MVIFLSCKVSNSDPLSPEEIYLYTKEIEKKNENPSYYVSKETLLYGEEGELPFSLYKQRKIVLGWLFTCNA